MGMERTAWYYNFIRQIYSHMDNMTSLLTQFFDKHEEPKAHDISSVDHVFVNFACDSAQIGVR